MPPDPWDSGHRKRQLVYTARTHHADVGAWMRRICESGAHPQLQIGRLEGNLTELKLSTEPAGAISIWYFCLALVRGDGLAIRREAGVKVVVGVGGQKMEGAVRKVTMANLLAPKSSFGSRSRDEQADMSGSKKVRSRCGFLRSPPASQSQWRRPGEKPAYVLRGRLNDGYDDDLAIGRP